MRSHTFKLAARFGLATLTQGLLVLGVTTLAAAQDGAELPPPVLQSPAPGQAQAMDSPSDRPFEGGPAADTWANPAVDSYGSCSGCNSCGSSYGGCNSCGSSYGGCNTCGANYGGCGYGGYDSCGGYGSCGGCADCDAGCGLLDKIVGHFAPSDRCFSNFVAPITNSVFFEDPRTLTQARMLFINHQLPDALGGVTFRSMPCNCGPRSTIASRSSPSKTGSLSGSPTLRWTMDGRTSASASSICCGPIAAVSNCWPVVSRSNCRPVRNAPCKGTATASSTSS